jgi:hypothetical protein
MGIRAAESFGERRSLNVGLDDTANSLGPLLGLHAIYRLRFSSATQVVGFLRSCYNVHDGCDFYPGGS